MGFFKKMFGDAVDDLKRSFEDSKKEMLNSLSEAKKDALGSFTQKTSASKVVDDDDDDDEPRINMGKLVDGVLTISESFSELDDESLEDYKRLRQIVFPASLKKLDSDVICDQEKLEIVDFSKVTHLKEIPDDFISGETRIKEFVIPQGVTEVGDGFLGECGAGTKIFVPASIKKLGYINGNSNNDQFVYLFASNIDISDVEQDIKTLYVLPEFYGYYAKQLKECESEARLREMPAEMMDVYGANEPKQISEAKQTTKPEPHKIIPSGVISTQNNELRDFKRKKMSDLREARDEKDRSRTPENMNKWKKVVADIEVIDTALKAGATTFGELKELAKDNASIIVEIDEIQASQLKAKQKQESQKKKEKVRVSFNINGEEGFTRITMYPLIGKECQQTLKNGVEHDRRTGAMEVSQDCIDKLSELLSEKDEQLPLEFLFAPVSTPTELIVTDEESDEEIYNEEYEINPRYGIMSMDEAVDNYEDEEGELKEYKEYLTDTAHTPDDNYISIGIAKTWDKLPESYIEGEGFVPSVIGETLKVASEDNIALLHGETGLSDSTITFILEIEDEFDPDKLDFINFDAEYGDVSSVLQETLAADFVSMNAIMYDGKMYFAQPQNMDLGENEGDDYYDIVNYHLEGDQEIDFESESELESEDKIVESSDKEEKVVKEVVSKIKQKLQSLGMSSFTLYGSDYEGDKEYEEVEQLGNDGLLESSSEYAINYNDSYNGFSSVYTKVRKINIQDGNVLFDLEEIYEDNNGEYESKGYYADQSIDRILSTCKKDTVESGFERILNYLSDETLIKLNKGIDSEVKPIPQAETKTESNSEPESKTEVGSGLFSARLEALINSALQDGVLTEQEKAILKKRAEAEGEDWDEVEMIINARLAERQTGSQPEAREDPILEKTNDNESIKIVKEKTKNPQKLLPNVKYEIIPEGIQEIGKDNADYFESEGIKFPSSLKRINSKAFNNFIYLKAIDFSQCLNLEIICDDAFWDCEKLESIIFPASLKTIEPNAFSGCKSLKEVDLSQCVHMEVINESFYDCEKLASILLPASIKTIEHGVFSSCSSLKEVNLSQCVHLEVISDFAFYGCKNLASIQLPASLKAIGEDAFGGCESLKEVDFSRCVKLERIGHSAFSDCEKIEEVDFSHCVSLNWFSNTVLKGCTNIRKIDFSGCVDLNLPLLDIEGSKLEKLILPPGQESFNAMFVWDQFGYPVDTSKCTNVKVIYDEVFAGMKIKEIVIPDSVEVIGKNNDGDGPFYECENLKTIVMPAALKEIIAPLGGYMEELKKIDFSKVRNLRTIPKKFVDRGCYKLKELIIPQGVTEIEDEAFGYIENLKRLFLPPTLESIGDLGQTRVSVYCFSPSLEELEPLVYGWDDDDDDDKDWDDDDLEDLDEEDREELKEEKKEMKINLYVLPQYLDKYIAQRKAEEIPEDVLVIQEIPEEYRYYYDN